MSGVLAVERESARLYKFQCGHVTLLVLCWWGMGAWGWVWCVGLGKVQVVVCDTWCRVWGIM